MKKGNWIPLDKNLVKYLPRNRSFSEVEAVFSVTFDYDSDNDVTVSGYASRWGWSRKKVKVFLDKMGVEISYPKNTKSMQNQRGQIKEQIRDRSGTDKGQINFIDSKWLANERSRSGTDKEQIRSRSGSTTINPKNPNPNPNPKRNSFSQNSIEFELSSSLLSNIRNHKPDFKEPNLQKWAESVDLMIRVDKRSSTKIREVMKWCQSDEFWRSNILSMSKLRKQFDALEIKMNSRNGTNQKQQGAKYDPEFAALGDE